MQKTNKIAAVILCGIMILLTTIFILLYSGIIWFNHPSKTEFPVRGIDVSIYQGIIDWMVLSKQGIHFAYIKAAEGSSGLTQAENFISEEKFIDMNVFQGSLEELFNLGQ